MKSAEPISSKRIVITGATSGAGRAAALEFAAHRATLILAARNEKALSDLAAECEAIGARVSIIAGDVSEPGSMIDLAAAALSFAGGIDVWINNAGVLAAGAFEVTPMEVHAQVVKTNLLGYMNGAHAVMPYFKKQGYGILINNISVGGFLPVPFGAGYSASKFGLRGFSEALKGELYQWPDIHVCDLYPAFLDTPGIAHAANYTGKVLKPAPPVYDPRRVALAMVAVVKRPRRSVSIGSASTILRLAYALFPGTTRRAMTGVMQTYLSQADQTPLTSGNVFNPLDYGTSMHGGWGKPGKPGAHRKFIAAGLLVTALAAAISLMSDKRASNL